MCLGRESVTGKQSQYRWDVIAQEKAARRRALVLPLSLGSDVRKIEQKA